MVSKKQRKRLDPDEPILKRKKVKFTKKVIDRIIDIVIDKFITIKKRNKKSR